LSEWGAPVIGASFLMQLLNAFVEAGDGERIHAVIHEFPRQLD
jgi:hypothetical protein